MKQTTTATTSIASLLLVLLMLCQTCLISCFQTLLLHNKKPLQGPTPTPKSVHKLWMARDEQTVNRRRQSRSSRRQEREDVDEGLSDVDARVLREMLQESKLDLETEEDVRKLLDRGVQKRATTPTPDPIMEEYDEYPSAFESEALKTLTNSRMWRALQAKASDILESASLWVANGVERSVGTLAALGVFAWDRAVQDVARALPAAGSSARTMQNLLLLANTSSFEELQELQRQQQQATEEEPLTADALREQLNRPADEIKSVSRAIWDILNGKTTSGGADVSGRGLRTVAKAGTANMADRQQRAFQQQRKKRQQEELGLNTMAKIPGSIVDATYELERELQSETNPAGYKTKPVRQAIEAGVVGTGKYLEGIKESARLAAAERKAKRLQAAAAASLAAADAVAAVVSTEDASVSSSSSSSPSSAAAATIEPPAAPTPNVQQPKTVKAAAPAAEQRPQLDGSKLLMDLKMERDAIFDRVMACISRPEETWLQSELLTMEAKSLSEESLREVATLMILLKDELNTTSTLFAYDEEETVESSLQQLRVDLKFIEQLRASVATTISMSIGNALFDVIVGKYDAFESGEPTLLRLREIEDSWKQQKWRHKARTAAPAMQEEEQVAFFADAVATAEAPLPSPKAPPAASVSEVTPPPPAEAVHREVAEPYTEDMVSEQQTDTTFEGDVVQDDEWGSAAEDEYAPYSYANVDDEEDVVDDEEDCDEWVEDTVKYVEVERNEEIPVVVSRGPVNAAVVDVVPESVFSSRDDVSVSVGDDAVVVDADTGAVRVVEVVSDDDFDTAVGEARTVELEGDDELEEAETPNFVFTAVLRSLDVAFFVLEKIFIVAVPRTVLLASTAAKRLDEINQGGKGRKGWETIRNTADPKGRY